MARAQTITFSGYDASSLGLPRLFSPPPSLDGKLAGAYVLSNREWAAPLFDWSGNDRTLVPTNVAIGDAPPSLSATSYLEVPLTGVQLLAPTGKATLIAVHRTSYATPSMLISNYANSGDKISLGCEQGMVKAYPAYSGSGSGAQVAAEARGGSYEMAAASFAPDKVQVYRRRERAQVLLSFGTQPVAGNTLSIGGAVATYVASGAAGAQINIGSSGVDAATNTANYINTNSATLGVTALQQGAFVIVVANARGAAGNGIAVAASGAAPTLPTGTATVGGSSLLTATASTATSVGGGAGNLRLGASFVASVFSGPSSIAAAFLVTAELTQAQLDTVYGELTDSLSDYGVLL